MHKSIRSFSQAFEEICSSLPQILGETSTDSPHPLSLGQGYFDPSDEIHNISLEISALRERTKNGLSMILNEFKNSPDSSIRTQGKKLGEELSAAFSSLLSPAPFTQAILKVVSGESWREALNISQDSLNALYANARSIYEDGRFTDAMDAFVFLSWFDARQYDFWMALGHTQFHTGQYSAAISSYGVARQCLPDESWPEIYSAICFEAMAEIDKAIQCAIDAVRLEKQKKSPHSDLIVALEHKIDGYRRKAETPIS